jgi:hypothetical protein
MSAAEQSNRVREDVNPRGCAAADEKGPAVETAEVDHRLAGVVGGGHDACRARLKNTTRLGERDFSPTPREELVPEFALQFLNVLRQRWLREVDALRATAEAAFSRHGEKALKLAEGHWVSLSESSKQRIGPYIVWRRKTRASSNAVVRRCPMIFRQFLVPKTGCASYLFG